MSFPNERRKPRPEPDEALSPEYLAVLAACGGDVRQGDHAAGPHQGPDRRQHPRRRRDDRLPPLTLVSTTAIFPDLWDDVDAPGAP